MSKSKKSKASKPQSSGFGPLFPEPAIGERNLNNLDSASEKVGSY